MSVRVRFAPSPTGPLHIGGVRTALYSYLYARARAGKYILRIEDTDLERSTREFEDKLIDDLKWCGVFHDEGPDVGGNFAPYRQSERIEIYKKYAWQLVDEGYAYPCFLTSEELDQLTAKAQDEKKAPHAYHGKFRDLSLEEAKKRIETGEEYVIRFKNPGTTQSFKDIVRGEVTFPEDMVGDFVLLRASGLPVYNFCCVIDDILMEITHVIRAEEHLNNTCRQLMLYKALKAPLPAFAHVSLLVGEDRQKLSKRHGATSLAQYREQFYFPEAILNYLCLLGWSHPEEKDIFSMEEIIPLFDLERFSKNPALYDIQKLNFFNEQHLRNLAKNNLPELCKRFQEMIPAKHPFREKSEVWQHTFLELFAEKIQLLTEYVEKFEDLHREDLVSDDEAAIEIRAGETFSQVQSFYLEKLNQETREYIPDTDWKEWTSELKKQKITGKSLFMGTRVALTGSTQGADLARSLALTPVSILKKRLSL